MVVAIIPTVKIADSTSDELAVVNDADASGTGIIRYGKYDLDMDTKTTTKVYPVQMGKHGSQVIKTEQAHYGAGGYKFGFADEFSFIAKSGETDAWLLVAGARNVIIDKITFMTHLSGGGAQIEYKVYTQNTIADNGAAITIGNLLGGNATTATCGAYNSPAIDTRGTQVAEINVLEGYSFDTVGENNMGMVASTGNILITGTSSLDRTGCVMVWFHEVTT